MAKSTLACLAEGCNLSEVVNSSTMKGRSKAQAHRERGGVCKFCFQQGKQAVKPTHRQGTNRADENRVVKVSCGNHRCQSLRVQDTVTLRDGSVKERVSQVAAKKEMTYSEAAERAKSDDLWTCSDECAEVVALRRKAKAEKSQGTSSKRAANGRFTKSS